MDKEGFAIVSTFKRLSYLLWGGLAIHCDNRNLARIFGATERPHSRRWHNVNKDGVCFSDSSRTPSCTPLAMTTAGGNLLLRWVTRPGGSVFVHASVKDAEMLFVGSDKFPTKEVVRGVQAAAAGDGLNFDTALGVASLDSEGLYLVEYHATVWSGCRPRPSL